MEKLTLLMFLIYNMEKIRTENNEHRNSFIRRRRRKVRK